MRAVGRKRGATAYLGKEASMGTPCHVIGEGGLEARDPDRAIRGEKFLIPRIFEAARFQHLDEDLAVVAP